MIAVPKVYYHKDIVSIVDECIDLKFLTYDECPEFYKERLTALCIQVLEEDGYMFITEAENLMATLKSLTFYIRNSSDINANHVAENLKIGALNHAEKSMSLLFEERVDYIR